MNNDLNLPIIQGSSGESRILSMDDYLRFVQFNLQNAFDRDAYAERKRMLAVDAIFSIK